MSTQLVTTSQKRTTNNNEACPQRQPDLLAMEANKTTQAFQLFDPRKNIERREPHAPGCPRHGGRTSGNCCEALSSCVSSSLYTVVVPDWF